MLDTILFDLDGTLLPLDLEKFIKIYFAEMRSSFRDLMDPEKLVKCIWIATEAMVKNVEERTNEVVFMEKFSQLIDGDLAVFQQRFSEFYDGGFLKTQESVLKSSVMHEAVCRLREKGYNLIIATNPLFPKEAIYHRIRWAGFEPSDFPYITSYERNHYCKPQPHFYQEVLREINKQPEQCLMVGNDVQEDLVALTTGMETYLITDHLIHRNDEPIQTTYQGTYEDFLGFVNQLESLKPVS